MVFKKLFRKLSYLYDIEDGVRIQISKRSATCLGNDGITISDWKYPQ